MTPPTPSVRADRVSCTLPVNHRSHALADQGGIVVPKRPAWSAALELLRELVSWRSWRARVRERLSRRRRRRLLAKPRRSFFSQLRVEGLEPRFAPGDALNGVVLASM